jgi:hypothetical protein
MFSSKISGETCSSREEKGNSVSDAKNDMPRINPVQAGSDAPMGAKKVRSSRYEWESKSGENEHSPNATGADQRSLLTSLGALVKRFFFGDRDMFDNDDDASPSAA